MILRGEKMGHTAVSVSKPSSVNLYNWINGPDKITIIWQVLQESVKSK